MLSIFSSITKENKMEKDGNQLEIVLHSVFRTIVSFVILMCVAAWIGKQINSHKTYHNYALSIIMGSFVANMGFDVNLKFTPMLAALMTIIFIYYGFSFLSFKSRTFRSWIAGQPTVMIEKGKILDANMKKTKYTLDNLNQQLRESGIFDIGEVEYALLEVSGNLSVLKNVQSQNLVTGDLHLNDPQKRINLPIELIMDKKLIEKNFTSQYTRQWLEQELKKKNLSSKEVQYAVISTSGNLHIDKYQDHLNSPVDKE
jgi:uncharacterized membrane protein YcaP (DUF421 family)